MQVVIMASGLGTRMRPLTLERPKPLVEVAGKPIIEYILDALPEEIDEIILIVGYKAQMIQDRIGDSYNGIPVRYVFQWMPAGTAHALSIARPFIHGTFLLLNADDILGAPALKEALRHPLAILAAPHQHPEKFGVIKKKEDQTMESIIEKPKDPPSNLVSTGAMVLDERIFNYPAERHESGEYYMTSPLGLLAAEYPIQVVEQEIWIPVGSPEDIPIAEARLQEMSIEEEEKR